MALIDVMSGGNSFRKVSVDEIRPNRENFYASISNNEDQMVEDMAELIQEYGQDENGVVYMDESVGDGKKYTLLAGERRFKAIKLNYEKGIGDGLFQVKVVAKPKDVTEELIRIIMYNGIRNKSKDVRKAEVDALCMCWEEMDAQGAKPQGKKRDWIAGKIGMSPRQVQEYLTGEFSEQEIDTEPQEDGSTATSEKAEKKKGLELSSADKDTLNSLQEHLKASTGRKVKINQKDCSVTFYPNKDVDAMEDLYTILHDFGFTDQGYWE